MKKISIIIILVLFSILTHAQVKDTLKKTKKDSLVFTPIDVQPEFPGGFGKFFKYINANKKQTGDTGKVMVSFIIEKDGSLTAISIIKGLSADADKETLRLMANSPKWNPGQQGGKPVRSRYTLPIKFGDD